MGIIDEQAAEPEATKPEVAPEESATSEDAKKEAKTTAEILVAGLSPVFLTRWRVKWSFRENDSSYKSHFLSINL
jgi:hypothetical protein